MVFKISVYPSAENGLFNRIPDNPNKMHNFHQLILV